MDVCFFYRVDDGNGKLILIKRGFGRFWKWKYFGVSFKGDKIFLGFLIGYGKEGEERLLISGI